ncbi:tetratricopeptide repeat protein [Kovacikia minuta CCNUW1]|uniref:tetratricopeptide repeat protein n=1 Tax=Kovacikia minuta TaxID=2931930 RepID=UPI001CCFE412|nr:tetratricopeptide repeat protein [Kovacikia minuta]UBF27824.1 tetratricopeptide repeat protein [Kovacikia minuta CCNUW1]
MQLADRSSNLDPALPDSASSLFSEPNQGVYRNLKLSLSLNLRRQIFLAVCDDLALRNRLAAQLYAELAYPPQLSTSSGSPSKIASRRLDGLSPANDGIRTDTLAIKQSLPLAYPRLVSLNLNLSAPNPMAQIKQWLEQYPPPKNIHQQCHPPGFQILGAERLTRQPALVQKQFLSSLQQIEQSLVCMESPLLLWLSRPWLRAIQQSAPVFWNWHTALFEFEGDPTPVPVATFDVSPAAHNQTVSTGSQNPQKQSPAIVNPDRRQQPKSGSDVSAKQKRTQPIPTNPPQSGAKVAKAKKSGSPRPTTKIDQDLSDSNLTESTASQEDLWDILTHDLALLKGNQGAALPPEPQHPADLPSQEHPQPPPDPQLQHLQGLTQQPSNPPLEIREQEETEKGLFASPPVQVASATKGTPEKKQAVKPVALPYEPHSVQDLANFVLAIALEDPNSETVEEHSDLIQALEKIEQLHLQQAPPEALATAYQNLGNLYRDRVEQGDDSEQSVMIAICAYEQVLGWLDEASPLWSDVLNDIGNLYWMLSRSSPSSEQALAQLERAIATYQFGLSKTHLPTQPQNYAMIQNNLGSAYGDLARYRNPREALEQSVKAYEEALAYRKLEDDPARYAATQNNLGTAYWNLAQHFQPVRCLQRAIAAYNEALRYYSPQREPIYYAMIQNNLGTAFWNLAQHKQSAPDEDGMDGRVKSPADWLQRAIAAYQNALTYRTMETVPAAYAATQNNLGTAHWHLANLSGIQPEDGWEHLRQAIAAYEATLVAVNYLLTADPDHPPPLTFDPAATHNNLGLAYYQIALDKQNPNKPSNRSEYLEFALRHHLQALQGWQQNPDFYQTALNYLIQTVRAFYSELGAKGQNLALSKIPPSLLPEIMKRL